MYITLCDSCQTAIDDIGVLFVKDFIVLNTPNPIENFPSPQILYKGTFITDKENWVHYTGFFTAVGGEQYMLIGSFSEPDSINTIILPSGVSWDHRATYMVDNIILIECNQVGINEKPITPIKAYPNPSNGIFTIESSKPIEQLKIYNAFGQVIPSLNPSPLREGLLKQR
ncbi:MAG: T9SS type A sorting domain-containing protein [Sphingobacteriales bacterium JAD_PAG50586_3]|nr:MAG: T9SS type A sorting domain-containing protein [Sphingobacteriales bacterium JAD_PAG50586_3]